MKTAEEIERLELLADCHFQNSKDDMDARELFGYGFKCGYEESKWISVKERLPEEADRPYRVLVIETFKHPKGDYNGQNKISVFQDRTVRSFPDMFTHWQPLPTPPTK